MARSTLTPRRTAGGSGLDVAFETSDSSAPTGPRRIDEGSMQQRSRNLLLVDSRRHRRRRSAVRERMPALSLPLLLMLAALLLFSSVPMCRAGKDKEVSSEPTLPPPVSAPAIVPLPDAADDDDYYDNGDDDGDDQAIEGPGVDQGGGGGPNDGGGGEGPGEPVVDDKEDKKDDDDKNTDDKKGDDDKDPGGAGAGAGGGGATTTTKAPTSAPVAASGGGGGGGGTSTSTTYAVSLPIMELDLVLATAEEGGGSARRRRQRQQQQQQKAQPNDRGLAASGTTATTSGSLDADKVDAALENFLTTFLERSHRDTLQGVQLDTSVDAYQPATGVSRVLATDGTATFRGEQVQQADLADTIKTYLSFWGVQDLITAMHDQAGLNVLALNVTLDGVPVQPQVQVVDTGGDGTASGGGSGTGNDGEGGSGTSGSSSSSSSSSKSKDNSTLIVVIAVLGTLAVLLLAGTLWIVMKRRNSSRAQVNKHLGRSSLDGGRCEFDDDDTQSYSPRPSSGRASSSRFRILRTASAGSKSNVSTPNASPSRLSRALSDDFRSLSGVVSVEESIFTSTDAGGNNNNGGGGRSVGGDVWWSARHRHVPTATYSTTRAASTT